MEVLQNGGFKKNICFGLNDLDPWMNFGVNEWNPPKIYLITEKKTPWYNIDCMYYLLYDKLVTVGCKEMVA